MTTVAIRQVQGEELLDTHYPLVTYGFMESPSTRTREDNEKFLPYQVDKYILVTFQDDKPVATATSIHMTQTVRGRVFKMSGVAAVASMPQVRRQGYVRQLMRCLYENMEQENEAVTSLYPFRESFYGRLGYIGFPQLRVLHLAPIDLTPVLNYAVPGKVEVVDFKTGFDTYITFLKALQPSVHGMALHPDSSSASARDNFIQWLAIASLDREVIGIMSYRLGGFGKDIKSYRFMYKNSTGKYLLLQWIARHADQVKEVWLNLSPGEFMETWAYDQNIRVQTQHAVDGTPTPMGRVAIVEQLGGMHTGLGRFSARITDEDCAWNNGIYTFETEEGLLTVRPAQQADCDLTIQGLSALVFCGYDPADFAFRGWGNPSPAVQAIMRAMFPPALPFVFASY